MLNPVFDQLLDEMRALHARKNQDYASDTNPFSNFEEAAEEAGVEVADVFAVLIGIKNARIRELERSGKTPQNESLMDSYLDRCMYVALDLAYRRQQIADEAAHEAWVDTHGYGCGV